MKKHILTAALILALSLPLCAQVRLVGHRGVRHNTRTEPESPYYENTIAALKFNQSLGIYAAEFDVQLTADNKIIVFHGPTVPGLEKSIQKITFDEARAVVLPGGHRMPTLEEYLKQGKKDPKTKLILEIKKQATPERETMAVEQCMAVVRKMKMEDQIEYTTFSEWIVREIHRIDPKAKVLFIDSGVFILDPETCKGFGADAVSYDMNGLMNHPDYIERAHALGMEVTFWIINDYEPLEWAILHGVDFVSSDHPERLKEYVEGLRSFPKR